MLWLESQLKFCERLLHLNFINDQLTLDCLTRKAVLSSVASDLCMVIT